MELLVTKFEMPASSGPLVHRDRLVQRLDEALDSPLTIVAAAAGSGKTTLAIDWRRSDLAPDRSVAWLSLEARDDEPSRFWSYVIGALVELGIGDLPDLPDRFDVRVDPGAEPFLNAILNRLAVGPAGAVVVLDDFHHITDPVVLAGVEYLVRHLPGRTHLVLLTRRQPDLSLDTLRLRSTLDEIDGRDLRFTDGELEELFRQVAGVELAVDDVTRIQAATEGWAAALKLAALALRRTGDLDDLLAGLETGTPQFLSEFLVREVLERQDEELRTFVAESAVLGRFTASMCDEVTGRDNSAELARRVRDEHLFLQRLDRDGGTFRYHPLFASIVRQHLVERDAERVATINAGASRWFEDHGDLELAVRHAHRAHDHDRVVDLVLANVADMVGIRGARSAIDDWATLLRASETDVRDQVLAGGACTLALVGRPIEAIALLDGLPQADDRDENTDVAPLDFFARTFVAFEEGDFDRILELTDRPVPWPVVEGFGVHLQRLAHEQRGRALMLLDRDDEARVALHRALSILEPPLDPTYIIIPALLSQLDVRAGRLTSAERWAEMSLQRADEVGYRDAPVTSEAWSALAAAALDRGDVDVAEEQAQRSRLLAERIGSNPWAVCLSLLCEARVHAARDDTAGAREVLRQLSDTHPYGQLPVTMRHLIARESLDHALRVDDVDEIRRWRDELAGNDALGPARRISAVLHLDGVERAELVADEFYSALDHRSTRRRRVAVCIAVAEVFEQAGRHDEALVAVGRALEDAEPEGMVAGFQFAGPLIAELIAEVAVRGRTVTRASPRFLEQLTGAASPPPVETAASADGDLSEREMSVLRMLRSPLSLSEIAGELHVSHNTVKTHVQSIYRKLGTRNRAQTIEQAREEGLLV